MARIPVEGLIKRQLGDLVASEFGDREERGQGNRRRRGVERLVFLVIVFHCASASAVWALVGRAAR